MAIQNSKNKIAEEAYKKGRQDEHNMIANQLLNNFIQSPNSKLIVPQTSVQPNTCNCQKPLPPLDKSKVEKLSKSNK